MAPDLLAGVAAWVSVAAAVSLGGSIFCGTLWVGIGPGFVMVVIVVGIIRVDMVSIFAMWSLSRRGESRRMKVSSRDREESPRYWTTLILDAIAIADLYRYSTTLAVRFRKRGEGDCRSAARAIHAKRIARTCVVELRWQLIEATNMIVIKR